jgi:putative tricarboxylic transport membrane protein
MIESMILGLQVALQPENLIYIIVGSLLGTLVGALPGLGAAAALPLLLPFTYNMPVTGALLLLVSLYQASEYGGSISSILVSTPGTPAAAATLLDGYPLARKGYPGKALGYSLTASTIGGFFGVFVLIFLSYPLSIVALRFGPAEYFSLGLFGLTAVAALSSKDIPKSIISVLFGLTLATFGVDVFSGNPRFDFGQMALFEGIPLIPILIGLFAVSESFRMIGEDLEFKLKMDKKALNVWLNAKEVKSILKISLKSGIIGSLVGIFPGLGTGPAAWMAYGEAKRSSKTPEKFGEGCPEGIAAPESANNAAVGGALIPLITLGIPGSPATAVIMGALIIQGIQPGPEIFEKMPEMTYGLFAGLLIATFFMYLIGLFTTNLWARIVKCPNWVLAPTVLVLSTVGSYITRNLIFDVWLTIGFGVIGYAMRKLDYSLPSIILGFILGFLIETSLRRALILSDGSYSIFFTRPVSLAFLALAVLFFAGGLRRYLKTKKEKSLKTV